jgi:hypothetical protein
MHDGHDRPGDEGLACLGRDEDPPIDAERDPGGARYLATGAGGAGDWIASAAGIGQRRGPADDDRPFDVDDDATGWAAGGDRHDRDDPSPTDRVGGEHGGDERDDAPPRPPASVPQDSPTARDQARGRFSLPLPGGAGKSG